MKMTKWLISCVVVAALSVGMVGCGGGSDDGSDGLGGGDGNGAGDVYLTCKVNGENVRIDGLGCVVANYQVHEDETVVQTGGPGDYRFVIVVPGQDTGHWSLGVHYLSLAVTMMDDMATYVSSTDQDDEGAALQVAVTSYGSVGGYVSGTFSGTAVNIRGGSTLTITDGKFHALRIADVTP